MNKTISRYLKQNILFPDFINEPVCKDLGIIVVIPCFNETDLLPTLDSLVHCEDPGVHIEVIFSINASEKASEEVRTVNRQAKETIEQYDHNVDWLTFFAIMNNELPHKKAGVGQGRKIGMDEAVKRFLSIENHNGIIVCYDADSQCDSNYLKSLIDCFAQKNVASCSIYFEHPIQETSYSKEVLAGIIQYEMHLRYFIQMQKKSKTPLCCTYSRK